MDGEIEPEDLARRLEAGEGADGGDGGEGANGGDCGEGANGGKGWDGGDGSVPVLVDIRSPAAFREAHIPGSLNLPLGDLAGGVEALAGAEHVVTVCPHGEASVQAARLIAAYEGFDGTVESLAGGLDAWDGPLEAGPGEAGDSPASGDAGNGADADGASAPF